jgi:hypothetical protein
MFCLLGFALLLLGLTLFLLGILFLREAKKVIVHTVATSLRVWNISRGRLTLALFRRAFVRGFRGILLGILSPIATSFKLGVKPA